MKILIAVSILSAALAACSDNKKHVDNEAVRYAVSLKEDAMRAKEAAKKANAAVAAQDNRMQEADDLTK